MEVEVLLGTSSGAFVPVPKYPFVVYPVELVLQRVVDLTLPAERKKLRMSVQELTGDWRSSSPDAPTQLLGRQLFLTPGIEAFRTISAKSTGNQNLIVFPEKLLQGSWMRFSHPGSGQYHFIEGIVRP